jgi:penicillin-binding protein 2
LAKPRRRVPSTFLPSDPRVVEPYRLTPKLALRLAILGALALGVFAILFLRLWALQVLSGEQYLRTAQNNQVRTLRIEAPRGVIRDREGRILVGNKVGTALQLWPADLPEEGRWQMIKRLAKVVRVSPNRVAREVDQRKNDPLNPVLVKADLSAAEVAYIAERDRDFPGVMLVRTYLRDYPYDKLAAHALGHVGEISEDQLERREYATLQPGDKIGQAGVEAAFDRYLRGAPGQERVRVDALGRPRSEITPTHSAKAGNDVQLTIDAELQLAAERALENAIASAHAQKCFGCWNSNGGSIVALDARTGEVLAMASNPTYDPRIFVGKPNPWRLRPLLVPAAAQRANIPGLNRAIAGAYAAGSTFKPVTAIAALEEQKVLPYESIPCTPSMTYVGENGVAYVFRNWDPFVNTAITMTTALSWSCDTYFYELGKRFFDLRTSPMQQWARAFGFGKSTGIELGPEAPGLIPTPLWRRQTYKTEVDRFWTPGDSIELTIGQGEMTVTPLQMARFYAMLANGGQLVTPHVFKEVEGPGRIPLVPRPTRPAPRKIDVSPGALQLVREGLFLATHDPNGTSSAVFGSFPVAIAGKTGTAEKSLPGYSLPFNHAWWCGYGPVDDPRLVVCVIVEYGGHGGSTAAPAAREVFAEFFDIEVDDIGPVASSETD